MMNIFSTLFFSLQAEIIFGVEKFGFVGFLRSNFDEFVNEFD